MGKGISVPMRKLTTGEPYAGELHVRFGGKGDLNQVFLTPIKRSIPKQVFEK